jgi:uncharacterized protein (DUF1330 family)
MAAYVIAQVRVKDAVAYEDYKKGVPASLKPYGGKFLVRGGKVETLEGDWTPQRFVIIEFPSIELAKAWYASPEYSAIIGIRQQNSDSELILVQGVE